MNRIKPKKIIILDTNIFLDWFKVPDKWNEANYASISNRLNDAKIKGHTLVIPLSVIIEIGNNITNAKKVDGKGGDVKISAKKFVDMLKELAEQDYHLEAFGQLKEGEYKWTLHPEKENSSFFSAEQIYKAAEEWLKKYTDNNFEKSLTFVDVSIKGTYDYYRKENPTYEVEIYSNDAQLRSYGEGKKKDKN